MFDNWESTPSPENLSAMERILSDIDTFYELAFLEMSTSEAGKISEARGTLAFVLDRMKRRMPLDPNTVRIVVATGCEAVEVKS